jgi:hypothetical protein
MSEKHIFISYKSEERPLPMYGGGFKPLVQFVTSR